MSLSGGRNDTFRDGNGTTAGGWIEPGRPRLESPRADRARDHPRVDPARYHAWRAIAASNALRSRLSVQTVTSPTKRENASPENGPRSFT